MSYQVLGARFGGVIAPPRRRSLSAAAASLTSGVSQRGLHHTKCGGIRSLDFEKRARGSGARAAPWPWAEQQTHTTSKSSAGEAGGSGPPPSSSSGHNPLSSASGTLYPWDVRYLAWTTVTTAAAAVSAFLLPWEVAFHPSHDLYDLHGLGSANLCLCALFAADSCLSFRMAYFEGDDLIEDRPSVARHYWQDGRLLADLAGCLPLDWLLLAAGCGLGAVQAGTPCLAWLPLVRLLQLVRLYRLKNFFRYLEYNLSVSLLNVTIVRNLLIVFVMTHWVACGFYYAGAGAGFNDDVLFGANGPFLASLSCGDAYMYSLYWSITTLSMVEPNEVASSMQQTMSATIRASLFMAFNTALGSYILGTITLLVVKNDERTGKFRDQSLNLRQYTEANSIPPELKASMQDHLRLYFDAQEASDEQVLSIFPTTIRRRIMQFLYMGRLKGSYLFQGVQQRFMDALLASARVEVFMPGVDIVGSGDAVHELFFLVSGSAEVICPSGALACRRPAGPSSSSHSSDGSSEGSTGSGSYDAGFATLGSLDWSSSPAADAGLPADIKLASLHSPLTKTLVGERQGVRAGTLLGEAAFFTEVPQLEAVRSVGVCRLLVVSRTAYSSLERAFPSSSRRVLQNLKAKAEAAVAAEFHGRISSKDLDALWFSLLTFNWASSELRDSLNSSLHGLPTLSLEDAGLADVSAWSTSQQQVVANLLRIRTLVHATMQKQEYERTTEFLWAAAAGDPRAVRQSLQQGIIGVNAADYDGRTALELACAKGHTDVVALLLASGADANATDNLGSCPLLEACKSGNDCIIELLLRAGARLNAAQVSAAQLCTCVFEGDLKLLRRLLRAGADVNAGDYDKRTALHISAAEGSLQAVRLLVEEGLAELTVEDRWGHTPLDEAERVGAGPVVRYLQGRMQLLELSGTTHASSQRLGSSQQSAAEPTS